MVVSHMLTVKKFKSHGTLPIRVRMIHKFGLEFLRQVAKHVQHKYASNNYPEDSKFGESMVQMVNDLTKIFLMFSPHHAPTNTT